MKKLYLDNGATTPILPAVLDAMLPYLREDYGNPQSLHSWGDVTRMAVDEARARVADLIGAQPEEIIFTATGTEANNFAIKGLARAYQSKGKHIVVSAVEHFSVLYSARTMEKQGFELTLVPVDHDGLVDPDAVFRSIRDDTILVSVMMANGEVGTIEPVKEIARRVHETGAVFHTDAVAAAGNIPVNVGELGVDALSLAGNQFYGPNGGAALWVRRGVRIIPLLDGGIQEGGRRAGTENVPAIVGLGKAAELARTEMNSRRDHLSPLRDRLIEGITQNIKHTILTGHRTRRLPGNASFCVEFIEGESMLMLLDHEGIAVASGSACTSKALKSSHVLSAMGVPTALAQGSLLFTLGIENNIRDIDYVVEKLPPIVERLRQMSPLYAKFVKGNTGGI